MKEKGLLRKRNKRLLPDGMDSFFEGFRQMGEWECTFGFAFEH